MGPPLPSPRLGRLKSLGSRSQSGGPRRTKTMRMSRVRSHPLPAGQTSSSATQSWWVQGCSGGWAQTACNGKKEKALSDRPEARRWTQLCPSPLPPQPWELYVQGVHSQEASLHKTEQRGPNPHPGPWGLKSPKALPGHYQAPFPLPPTTHLHTSAYTSAQPRSPPDRNPGG